MLLGEQVPRLLDFASRRMRRLGLYDLYAYVEALERAPADADGELARLVNRVTICETCFYRDPAQSEALRELLRALFLRHQRPLQIWCSACSTGEEAYTVAMLAAAAEVPVRILGTDINGEALGAARAARYQAWTLRHLPQPLMERYLRHGGDRFRLVDELRSTVTFRRHNLAEDAPPAPRGTGRRGWDVILCRNLFIYFHRARVEQAARRCLNALDDDGWLFLAAAESLHGLDVPGRAEAFAGTVGYRPLRSAAATAPEPTSGDAARRIRTLLRRNERDEILLVPDSGPFPASTAETDWMQVGISLLEADHPAAALVAFREAENETPLSPELHYWQALAHRREEAEGPYVEALRRTLFLAPDFWPAAFLLGSFHEERGESRPARVAYQQVLGAHQHHREETMNRYLRFAGPHFVTQYREDVATICRRKLGELRSISLS